MNVCRCFLHDAGPAVESETDSVSKNVVDHSSNPSNTGAVAAYFDFFAILKVEKKNPVFYFEIA